MAFQKDERNESSIAKYQPSVLQGNWQEEWYKKKERMIKFVQGMKNGELMHQYAGKFYARHEQEVNLSPESSQVKIGDRIMIVNPFIKSLQPKDEKKTYTGLSVAVVFFVDDYIRSPEIFSGMRLGCSGDMCPVIRNTFYLDTVDGRGKNGESLHYGEYFTINLLHPYGGTRLYVESLPPHFSSPIGYTEKQTVNLVADFSVYCRWKVVHIDPQRRKLVEGTPVPANTNISIVHASTNQALSAIEHWYPSVFGMQCDLTIENRENQFRRPFDTNIWQIRNDVQPGVMSKYRELIKGPSEQIHENA